MSEGPSPQVVPPGTNGGVSWLGTAAGAAGGACTGGVAWALEVVAPAASGGPPRWGAASLALGLLGGMAGNAFDSLLGATLQYSGVQGGKGGVPGSRVQGKRRCESGSSVQGGRGVEPGSGVQDGQGGEPGDSRSNGRQAGDSEVGFPSANGVSSRIASAQNSAESDARQRGIVGSPSSASRFIGTGRDLAGHQPVIGTGRDIGRNMKVPAGRVVSAPRSGVEHVCGRDLLSNNSVNALAAVFAAVVTGAAAATLETS